MKNIQFLKNAFVLSLTLSAYTSCTDLEENALDGIITAGDRAGTVNTAAFLETAKNGLREFQGQGQMFAMGEMSGDGLVGPTRGGDWDDNGAWRQLHTHTWDPLHIEVKNSWNSLLSNVYNCNQVIGNNGSASEVLQARFLRAFYYYHVVDLFGQAPHRPNGSDPEAPSLVWSRVEASQYCISELEAIVGSLPARNASDPSIISKDAAHFLLAKLYLNKAIFDGSGSFSASDMTKVVTNVDAMTNTLAANYWDNFAPNNNTSNELVFTSLNTTSSGGNVQSRWRMGSHYRQTPDGWNGFATLSEYYSKFNPNDNRIKNASSYMISNFGNPAGYQVGQQFAPGGTVPLNDRNEKPLIFTPSVTMITGGVTLETAGIRGMKYIPDVTNLGTPNNDYVLMRYSDALLMKAEAIARGGSGSIGTLAADLAARSGQAAVDLSNLDNIYAERGRELWWEGWRRNDMIRFGKFLNQRELKPYASASKFLLFPIPAGAMLNPNLTQNPGY